MPNAMKTLFVVGAILFAYVAVVEQRATVLRAALMAVLVILGSRLLLLIPCPGS